MKSIRLTKDIRDSIIHSVLTTWDIANPKISKSVLHEYLEKFVCKFPKKVFKEFPEYFKKSTFVYVVVDGLRFGVTHKESPLPNEEMHDYYVLETDWKKKILEY